MAWDSAFLELMPHTITVSTMTGFDAYGDPAHSTSGTTYRARVKEEPKLIRDFIGEEVISTVTVWVASTGQIPATSLVTLPGGDQPALLSVSQVPDEDGIHHNVLHFGPSGGAGRAG